MKLTCLKAGTSEHEYPSMNFRVETDLMDGVPVFLSQFLFGDFVLPF